MPYPTAANVTIDRTGAFVYDERVLPDPILTHFSRVCLVDKEQPSAKNSVQLYWGIALILAGVGVLLRNVRVIPRLAEFEAFSKSEVVIFYLLGLVLIFGGTRKVVRYFKAPQTPSSDERADSGDSR